MNHDHLVFETGLFLVEQCRDCPLPGYLILSPKRPVGSFSEMEDALLEEFGPVLHGACRLVEAVIRPERVYVLRFGEEHEALHFHIFPRTRELLQRYREEHGALTGPVSGPRLFDWAREKFKGGEDKATAGKVQDALEEMRALSAYFQHD